MSDPYEELAKSWDKEYDRLDRKSYDTGLPFWQREAMIREGHTLRACAAELRKVHKKAQEAAAAPACQHPRDFVEYSKTSDGTYVICHKCNQIIGAG